MNDDPSWVSACSLALFCVSGPKTGSKRGPKSPPAYSVIFADRAGHAYALSTRSRPSTFFSLPRVRMVHVNASFVQTPIHAFTSGTRSRRCDFFISRARVSHALASVFAGHLLSFLCSFHFCKLPLHSLSHSCPMKPETLNTQIKASNGNKRGLRLAKLRPKKHVFNHVIILGRKYKCMLIIWISG